MAKRMDSFELDIQQYLAERAVSTDTRSAHLTSLGYQVHEIYECDAERELKANPALLRQIMATSIMKHTPLVARDALYGGRTETITLMANGVLKYLDFTSLYSSVQKYTRLISTIFFLPE
jgi:hypothetical protein